MKLNKTDYQLIRELQRDGSASYSDMAEKLSITAKTVAKKTERLLADKMISIIARPNPYLLGLFSSAVIVLKTNLAKNEAICRALSENFHVNLVQTVFGRYDILAIVYFPDIEQLHRFIDDEIYAMDGVLKVKSYFIKDVFKRYDRFFGKQPCAGNPVKMKDTDWHFVKTLARDGRANPVQLARASGTHLSTVYRRIEALQKSGAIKISAVPNPSRLTPYSADAYVLLEAEPHEVDEICTKLSRFPEVQFLMTMNNHSGLILCIHSKNNGTLFQFIQQHVSYPKGLANVEIFVRAVIHKTYYGLVPDDWETRTTIN